ncbi:MAG: hypothetical protein NT069_21110 [Planctomycetota bacterium]|nr:hypothetical protein [Planctomycetota bacterium]
MTMPLSHHYVTLVLISPTGERRASPVPTLVDSQGVVAKWIVDFGVLLAEIAPGWRVEAEYSEREAAEQLLDTVEAAAAIGITPRTVLRRAAAAGVGIRKGRDLLLTPADVELIRHAARRPGQYDRAAAKKRAPRQAKRQPRKGQ